MLYSPWTVIDEIASRGFGRIISVQSSQAAGEAKRVSDFAPELPLTLSQSSRGFAATAALPLVRS